MLHVREFQLDRGIRTDWKRGQPARDSFVSLHLVRCPHLKRGARRELAMPSAEIERRVRAVDAAVRRNDGLIERAAKRTDLAGTALVGAAGDLGSARGRDGNALTGLAEVLLHDAQRLSQLAQDIESHKSVPQDG
jgi:hypothetical protein